MATMLWGFICFWAASVYSGFSFGWGCFFLIDSICIVITAALFFAAKRHRERWEPMEKLIRPYLLMILFGSSGLAALFVGPYIQFENQNGARSKAEKSVDDLTRQLGASEADRNHLTEALAMGKSGVDPYQWPGLYDNQIDQCVKTLQPLHIHSMIICVARETDAKPLCRGLAILADRLGCELNIQDVNSTFGAVPHSHKGMIIYSKEHTLGSVWVSLFSGFSATLGTDMPLSNPNDVFIFIGRREIAPLSPTPDKP
jgi:hypothetical protein